MLIGFGGAGHREEVENRVALFFSFFLDAGVGRAARHRERGKAVFLGVCCHCLPSRRELLTLEKICGHPACCLPLPKVCGRPTCCHPSPGIRGRFAYCHRSLDTLSELDTIVSLPITAGASRSPQSAPAPTSCNVPRPATFILFYL